MSYDPDLTDAITSLKCLLEEQFCPQKFPLLPDNDKSLAVLLVELKENTEKYLVELSEAVHDLNETMKEIASIQRKAMKWQEMFG
jgi:hypothetical protein